MNQSLKITAAVIEAKGTDFKLQELEIRPPVEDEVLALYTTNFTEPLSYQGSAFLKLPKFP
ncbi:hypothetical protein [Acinetobacter baumannii]|uniref:hypothetical protein n=1 Tax=Acinetobacter baumannii TaxID=470 RepID=UPI00101EE6DF